VCTINTYSTPTLIHFSGYVVAHEVACVTYNAYIFTVRLQLTQSNTCCVTVKHRSSNSRNLFHTNFNITEQCYMTKCWRWHTFLSVMCSVEERWHTVPCTAELLHLQLCCTNRQHKNQEMSQHVQTATAYTAITYDDYNIHYGVNKMRNKTTPMNKLHFSWMVSLNLLTHKTESSSCCKCLFWQ